LYFKADQIHYYPEVKEENTHFSLKGATEIAKIAVSQIKLLENPLVERLQKAIK